MNSSGMACRAERRAFAATSLVVFAATLSAFFVASNAPCRSALAAMAITADAGVR
jgi:hypothetical protein